MTQTAQTTQPTITTEPCFVVKPEQNSWTEYERSDTDKIMLLQSSSS